LDLSTPLRPMVFSSRPDANEPGAVWRRTGGCRCAGLRSAPSCDWVATTKRSDLNIAQAATRGVLRGDPRAKCGLWLNGGTQAPNSLPASNTWLRTRGT
jgi:hypothetical protein